MIADKLNQKKIDKKEKELVNLMEGIPIANEMIKAEYLESPEKLLVEEKVDKDQQETASELIELFIKSDQPEISIYNNVKFIILKMEFWRLKKMIKALPTHKSVVLFVNDVDNCISNPSNKRIEKTYQRYRKHLNHVYGDIDSFKFIKVINEGTLLLDPIIKELKLKVDKSEDFDIESVNYNQLENKFVFYYFLNYYRDSLQSVIKDVLKELLLKTKSLQSEILDKLDLNQIHEFEMMFEKNKNDLAPILYSNKLGIKQDNILKIQNKELELISLLSFDILFKNIKDDFSFRNYSKIGFASVLYDFFLITHRLHPAYEFYTKEEWWDEQDKKGNIPTNRLWKNHKLLRVKNIIPNF